VLMKGRGATPWRRAWNRCQRKKLAEFRAYMEKRSWRRQTTRALIPSRIMKLSSGTGAVSARGGGAR